MSHPWAWAICQKRRKSVAASAPLRQSSTTSSPALARSIAGSESGMALPQRFERSDVGGRALGPCHARRFVSGSQGNTGQPAAASARAASRFLLIKASSDMAAASRAYSNRVAPDAVRTCRAAHPIWPSRRRYGCPRAAVHRRGASGRFLPARRQVRDTRWWSASASGGRRSCGCCALPSWLASFLSFAMWPVAPASRTIRDNNISHVLMSSTCIITRDNVCGASALDENPSPLARRSHQGHPDAQSAIKAAEHKKCLAAYRLT